MILLGVSIIMDINIIAGIIKRICLDKAFGEACPCVEVILNNVANPRITSPETGKSTLIGDSNIFFSIMAEHYFFASFILFEVK